MNFRNLFICAAAGATLSLGAADLKFDFDGNNLPVKAQTVNGFSGKGILFAQENLKDFADLGAEVKKQGAITVPVTEFPASGELSFRYRPFFNQIKPYRNYQNKFTLYYLVNLRDESGPAVLAYIYKNDKKCELTVNFKMGVRKVALTKSVADWKPGEWHNIAIRWSADSKELVIDGKTAAKSTRKGDIAPAPDKLIIGGNGNDCSAQGVFDDVTLSTL